VHGSTLREKLLEQGREAARRRQISLSYLGRLVAGDSDFFARLERGGDCRLGTYERVMSQLTTNAPCCDEEPS